MTPLIDLTSQGFFSENSRIAMTHPDPLDPFREYLATFPFGCGQFSPNVGKHSSPMDPMGAVTFE